MLNRHKKLRKELLLDPASHEDFSLLTPHEREDVLLHRTLDSALQGSFSELKKKQSPRPLDTRSFQARLQDALQEIPQKEASLPSGSLPHRFLDTLHSLRSGYSFGLGGFALAGVVVASGVFITLSSRFSPGRPSGLAFQQESEPVALSAPAPFRDQGRRSSEAIMAPAEEIASFEGADDMVLEEESVAEEKVAPIRQKRRVAVEMVSSGLQPVSPGIYGVRESYPSLQGDYGEEEVFLEVDTRGPSIPSWLPGLRSSMGTAFAPMRLHPYGIESSLDLVRKLKEVALTRQRDRERERDLFQSFLLAGSDLERLEILYHLEEFYRKHQAFQKHFIVRQEIRRLGGDERPQDARERARSRNQAGSAGR